MKAAHSGIFPGKVATNVELKLFLQLHLKNFVLYIFYNQTPIHEISKQNPYVKNFLKLFCCRKIKRIIVDHKTLLKFWNFDQILKRAIINVHDD